MKRTFSRPIKRMVVKLGSSQIVDGQMRPQTALLSSLAGQIGQLSKRGVQVVLVSSGAIALGMGELGQKKRPSQLNQLQALAAIGQTALMHTYRELFDKIGLKCAQVLLTWDDFDNRSRHENASHTLEAILKQGVVPVINENDTISTEEIKFGDNDKLSALVATFINADLLIILSDVEGFYDENRQVHGEIKQLTPKIITMAEGTSNIQVAKGGMITKLDAIEIASHAKIPCVITAGNTENVLLRLVDGEKLGTLFHEKEKKLAAHKHWIRFVAGARGDLRVDEGAHKALLDGKSLLLPGIKSFEGDFKKNDVVCVTSSTGKILAKGISNYSSSDLHKIDDKKGKQEVIHRDHLILIQE